MYYRSLSMSESSTTLSQVSRERGRVSSVVNERLAVGQRGSGQKAEGQRGRIGFEQERKRAATRKSLGSSGSSRSQTQRQTGVRAEGAGPHSLMRVKSCICSRMQAVWNRQFDWRIGCWLHQLHACGRIETEQRRAPALVQRWTGLAKRCQSRRAALAGRRADTPSAQSGRVFVFPFPFPRATERSVVELAGGFNKGRRSALPLAGCSC